MSNKFKYIFGPVPSRRFGRSLGIDLTPFKTCTFDCVFCQLGSTGKTTIERKEFVPIDEVKKEIKVWADLKIPADCITLSGSGEPTLYKGFGEILSYAKKLTKLQTILLTNSSLLSLEEVRKEALNIDLVKASLGAWDDKSLRTINRPHPSIKFSEIFEGLKTFRKDFKGKLCIEVFLIDGINTSDEAIANISDLLSQIKPDIIHLNTSIRPPAEASIKPVSPEVMQRIARAFTPEAEMIAEFREAVTGNFIVNTEEILNLLERRPCSKKDLCQIFNMHPNEMAKYLGKLMTANKITAIEKKDEVYYQAIKTNPK